MRIFSSILCFLIILDVKCIFPLGIAGRFIVQPTKNKKQSQHKWAGTWAMNQCGNHQVRVFVNISESEINFRFCNPHKYKYYLNSSRVIVQGGPISRDRCLYFLPPSQQDIENSIRSAVSWTLNKSKTLVLKNNQSKVVAILQRESQESFFKKIDEQTGNKIIQENIKMKQNKQYNNKHKTDKFVQQIQLF